MAAEGLVPGARLLVSAAQSTDGSVEVSVTDQDDGLRAVRNDLARHIFVVPDDG